MSKSRLEPRDVAGIPFLAGLEPAEVEALCAAGEVREHLRGATIFKRGDPGRELHVIVEGEVAIELEVDSGTPRLLTTLNAGTVFGEINYLLGTERTATARALRPTRILVLGREALDGLVGTGRLAAVNLMETIARVLALRLSNMDRELADLCVHVTRNYPEASPVVSTLKAARDRVHHEWTF